MLTQNFHQLILGNHIGIVVSDEDPEGRGRIQVWVPHLSVGLYDNWNKEAKDITITKDLNSLPVDIDKIRKHLPWAESASPTFGDGGTTRFDRSTRAVHAKRINATLVSKPPNYNSLNGSGGSHVQRKSTDSSKPLIRVTSTYGPYTKSPAGETVEGNPDLNSLLSLGNNGNLLQNGDGLSAESPLNVALNDDSVKELSNAMGRPIARNDIVNVNGIYIKYADTVSNTKGSQIDIYANDEANWGAVKNAMNTLQGNINKAEFITNSKTEIPSEIKTWAASHKDEFKKLMEDGGWVVYTSPKDGNYSYVKDKTKSSHVPWMQVLQNVSGFDKIKSLVPGMGGSKTSSPAPVAENNIAQSGGPRGTKKGVDLTAGVSISPTSAKTPQGVISSPAVGNLVWVFFYGGDVQRPVYFASVTEPNATERVTPGSNTGRKRAGSGSGSGGDGLDKVEKELDTLEKAKKLFDSLDEETKRSFGQTWMAMETVQDSELWTENLSKLRGKDPEAAITFKGKEVYDVFTPIIAWGNNPNDTEFQFNSNLLTLDDLKELARIAPPELQSYYSDINNFENITVQEYRARYRFYQYLGENSPVPDTWEGFVKITKQKIEEEKKGEIITPW